MKRDEIIRVLSGYFKVKELVCPHIYSRWGECSWQFLDTVFLDTLLVIRRDILQRPMTCNSSNLTQRGVRCNMCQLVKEKDSVYMSAHILGKAGDFTVSGMSAGEARKKILSCAELLPFPIRMEAGVSWLHYDVLEQWGVEDKVYLFRG